AAVLFGDFHLVVSFGEVDLGENFCTRQLFQSAVDPWHRERVELADLVQWSKVERHSNRAIFLYDWDQLKAPLAVAVPNYAELEHLIDAFLSFLHQAHREATLRLVDRYGILGGHYTVLH